MDYSEIVKTYCLKFNKKFIDRDSMILLDKDIAIECTKYLDENGFYVMGVEGFLLWPNNRIQPHMEHSIDVTTMPYDNCTIKEKQNAIQLFFQQRPDGLHYEIVVEESNWIEND